MPRAGQSDQSTRISRTLMLKPYGMAAGYSWLIRIACAFQPSPAECSDLTRSGILRLRVRTSRIETLSSDL